MGRRGPRIYITQTTNKTRLWGGSATLFTRLRICVERKSKKGQKKKKKQPPVINRVTSTMQPRAFWKTCQATAEWGMVQLAILECLPSLVSLWWNISSHQFCDGQWRDSQPEIHFVGCTLSPGLLAL